MRKLPLLLLALIFAPGVRADIIDFEIMNATYSATCTGGVGTCTEVINGSFLANTAVSQITPYAIALSLTGSYNANLDSFGAPVCNLASCTEPPLFYDSGAISPFPPIEWNPTMSYPASTPTAFGPGSSLTVTPSCGGDQLNCGATGTFPRSGTAPYQIVSGTYEAIDITQAVQGGSSSTPVFLVSGTPGTPVAQITGSIDAGLEDYYSFNWLGGAFNASTVVSGAASVDSFIFSAGLTGSCNTLSSQTLNTGDNFSGTISLGNLAAGQYCIGLSEVSGTDPDFALTFNTPVNTAPEPSGFLLLSGGLGMIVLRYTKRGKRRS